jgi:hypothetical protein
MGSHGLIARGVAEMGSQRDRFGDIGMGKQRQSLNVACPVCALSFINMNPFQTSRIIPVILELSKMTRTSQRLTTTEEYAQLLDKFDTFCLIVMVSSGRDRL